MNTLLNKNGKRNKVVVVVVCTTRGKKGNLFVIHVVAVSLVGDPQSWERVSVM
jgi:hypothetical protein